MAQQRQRPTGRGATSLRDDNGGKKKGGWLWWLLLLAGIIALIAFLIARNAGDDGDKSGVDATDNSEQTTTDGSATTNADGATATDDTTDSDDTTATTSTGADAGEAGSVTTSEGTDLLPVPADGLGSSIGEQAAGTAVTVQAVVSDEGFWVGSSATNRIFLRLDISSESPQQVRAGQKVSFNGTVEELTDTPADFGVDASEGAAQLEDQGGYILVEGFDIQ